MASDMTKGNPIYLILSFAVPMLIGSVFQQFYSFADASILGKFVGDNALASVGATSGIVGILMSSVMGFTNGGGIIISQCVGAREYGKMKKTVTSLIYIVAVMSVVISVLGTLLSRPLLTMLSTPPEIMNEATDYLRVMFMFLSATVLYNASGSILRSMGDSKTPMVSLIISAIINIVLDLLFVAVMGLSVNGAAVATGIAQFISAFVNIGVMVHKRKELNLTELPKKPSGVFVAKIIKTGLPGALEMSLLSIGSVSVQRLINSFGAETIAAHIAACKIDAIAIAPIVSIGSSLSMYTAQNIGAGKQERIREGLYKVLAVLFAICAGIVAFIFVFRTKLLSLFIDSPQAIETGIEYLTIVTVAYFIAAIMRTYLNVLRGAGDVNMSAIAGMSELGAKIVFSYTLASFLDETGIWLATPISWAFGAAIPVIRYYSGKWKTKKLL